MGKARTLAAMADGVGASDIDNGAVTPAKLSTGAPTWDASGNLTAIADVKAYSDERLKTDWAELPADFVERLAGVKHGTYTRTDTGARQAGSSAQDWQALLPEVVGEGDHLSLAYGNAALVAVVALARRVVDLERRLSVFEG